MIRALLGGLVLTLAACPKVPAGSLKTVALYLAPGAGSDSRLGAHPEGAAPRGPATGRVRITLDRILLRGVPGVEAGDRVIIGVSLDVEGEKEVTWPIAVVRSAPDGSLLVDKAGGVFLPRYRGGTLILRLLVQSIVPKNLPEVRRRVAKVSRGGPIRFDDVARIESIRRASSSLFGTFRADRLLWSFPIRLQGATAGWQASADVPLLAGRHLVVLRARRASAKLARDLALSGAMLRWRAGGAPYAESSYVVFSLAR